MADQAKIAELRAKIRQATYRSAIWFSLTLLFFIMTVAGFALSVIVYTDASLTWLRALKGDAVAVVFGAFGIPLAVLSWKRTRTADRQKKQYNKKLHEEVLIPAGYEYCPFCKKRIKPQ